MQVVLESQPGIGTSVYITIPQNIRNVDQSQTREEQPFPFCMSTTLTPFRITETASPIPPSTRPTEHQKAVLRGKRVVILDGGKFLVRGLRKVFEQVACTRVHTSVQTLGFISTVQMEMRISYCNVEPHEPFTWLRTEASKVCENLRPSHSFTDRF